MNLDRFLNLLAAIFGALGAIYVMRGVLSMSPDLAARLASSAWGFSREQVESLAGQKGDSVAGVVFVMIAFVLTVITQAVVPDGLRVFEGRGIALALAAVLGGGAFIAVRLIGDGVSQHEKPEIGKVIASWYLDELSKRGRVETWDVPSLSAYARVMDLEVPPDEPARSLLGRIAAKAGKTLPPGLDYSAVEPKK